MNRRNALGVLGVGIAAGHGRSQLEVSQAPAKQQAANSTNRTPEKQGKKSRRDREKDKFKYWEAYPVAEKREVFLRTYEYRAPFKYRNIEVERTLVGGEPHGMELFVIPDELKEDFVYGSFLDDPTSGDRYADV